MLLTISHRQCTLTRFQNVVGPLKASKFDPKRSTVRNLALGLCTFAKVRIVLCYVALWSLAYRALWLPGLAHIPGHPNRSQAVAQNGFSSPGAVNIRIGSVSGYCCTTDIVPLTPDCHQSEGISNPSKHSKSCFKISHVLVARMVRDHENGRWISSASAQLSSAKPR